MLQKIDEDWRLSDGALTEVGTEEADSLEVVEMIDTDVTEDMEADGCDGGEALADADGLSMGDVSVDSIDEEGEKKKKKQEEEKLDDDPTEEPGFHVKTRQVLLSSDGEEKEEAAVSDCGVTCNILKLSCGRRATTKEKDGGNVRNVGFYEEQKQKQEDEPYYVSSEDVVIDRETMPRSGRAQEAAAAAATPEEPGERRCSEDYVKIGNNSEVRTTCEKKSSSFRARTAEALTLNHLDFPPRFRLVSISVPTDTDTSLTSSLSETQLASPNDSDVFGDEDDLDLDLDLDGHIVPFLEESAAAADISDDHVYEEPGRSLEAEHVFPFDRKSAGSRSLSHRGNNNNGVHHFVQRPYLSGFGPPPALSSSPMLSSPRHKSLAKPHYLSLYPRSLSMEGHDHHHASLSQRHRDAAAAAAICSSGSFSRVSPLLPSTPTSVSDIPPPFELAYITKRPITKSSPSLLIDGGGGGGGGDSSDKNRKKKSSIKRFLMLKFRRKTESSKSSAADANPSSMRSSPECSHHAAAAAAAAAGRLLDLDTHSLNNSPRLGARSCDPAAGFMFYKESKRKGNSVAFLNRSVVRVESFEDRSRVPFIPLPLTKPRSISFPNTDTSDYENVPPVISSDYENLQVPQRRPVRQAPFTDFFDRPGAVRALSSANDTDGYVDMSSLPGFRSKAQSPEEETESAYTEAYNVCSVAVAPPPAAAEDDQGRTSEEEDGAADNNYDRPPDGRSRAFYIAKELVDSERLHVKALKLLQEDFREAVGSAVGDEGEPVLEDERLREILNELPDVYSLHRRVCTELENRIRHWEESQRIADVFLSRRAEFLVFTTYIGHYDRSMSLLDDSVRASPAFAAIVHQFEQQSPAGEKVSLKHQLLQVIVRVAQYRMLLTDYLNNLSPDSKEYEETQAAVVIVSDIADQVNDSLKHGENLLRLVNIEYSVHGQRELLQPGRVFVKEGTLMKVSRKSRQPRHLFLMNDVLLYTYPQQDGKYRLKNTLPLAGLKVSKPLVENVQNALRIEGSDISITLSASSFLEREDWFYTLSRTVTEHTRGSAAFGSGDVRDRLHLSLGDKAPTLVPVSQVMMCMNCTSDFSLTLRRHHCHGCGRIVCRSCSRNRYPLKYMKDRMAKVCDHCYSELKKRGGDASPLTGKNSPRPQRSSRPLSAVFQNIHPPNIWRHRKGTMSFNQVTESDEGSISGALQRTKKSKRNWKRLWFLLKDKVLYTYRAQEEKVASETLPLLGFTVKLPETPEGEDEANVFQLYHKNTLFYSFKAEDNYTAQRWANAMEEATVL